MKIIYIVLLSIIIPSTVFEIIKEESTIQWKGTKSTGSYHDGLINIDNGFGAGYMAGNINTKMQGYQIS